MGNYIGDGFPCWDLSTFRKRSGRANSDAEERPQNVNKTTSGKLNKEMHVVVHTYTHVTHVHTHTRYY